MTKLLITTDVHGCLKTMLALIEKHGKDRQLILLGDLIDRGPDSRGVVEYAMENHVPTVAANHDDLALAYSAHITRGFKAKCPDEYDEDVWLCNGGIEALHSWDADFEVGLPNKVLQWMSDLPPYLLFEDKSQGYKILLSHSGYGLNADSGDWMSALWGRHPDDGPFPDDGFLRVFGHTKNHTAQGGSNWINIDTGCAYKGYGRLTGLLWPDMELVMQENID